MANAGARAGDALVFTKRIGTGVIGTALKRGIAADADVEAAIASMLTLNRRACEEMLRFDVHGCTDVTGFGLLGHAREMAVASGVTVEIAVGERPVSARRCGVCAAGRDSGRAEEQSRVRLLRGGERCRRCRAKSKTCCTIRRRPAAC